MLQTLHALLLDLVAVDDQARVGNDAPGFQFLAIGPEPFFRFPLGEGRFGFQVGDVVMMDKYSGQEVTIDDEEYVIVRADDLIAVVQK